MAKAKAATTEKRLAAAHLALAGACGQLSLILATGRREPGQLGRIENGVEASLQELRALRAELTK